jgi:hypothetical protein
MFDSDKDILEPPKFDTLFIQFRGDNHEVVLPYCEVANGDIGELNHSANSILVEIEKEQTTLSFKDFTKTIEKTFDLKEIVKLRIQKANAYQIFDIYES